MLSLTRPVLLSTFGLPTSMQPTGRQVDLEAAGDHEGAIQLLSIKDHLPQLRERMPDLVVYGLSTHNTTCLSQVRDRLQLPFECLSDARCELMDKLELPYMHDDEHRLLRRCTMLLKEGQVTRLDFPISQPSEAGPRAIELLRRDTGRP